MGDEHQPSGQRPLTIGELFPADDTAAHWVFTVTALAEDLAVLIAPLRRARDAEDLAASLFFYRQMLTRLYEARRLLTAARTIPEVERFAADLLKSPTGIDLNDYYGRATDKEPSVIERLYGEIRHRSVHYMHVGSDELTSVLDFHRRFPARIVHEARNGETHINYQWVQAISGMGLFGDPNDPDFLAKMQQGSNIAAAVAQAWVMVAGLAVMIHAHEHGIDTARLVERREDPG